MLIYDGCGSKSESTKMIKRIDCFLLEGLCYGGNQNLKLVVLLEKMMEFFSISVVKT